MGKSEARAGCGCNAGNSGKARGQDIIAAPTYRKTNKNIFGELNFFIFFDIIYNKL